MCTSNNSHCLATQCRFNESSFYLCSAVLLSVSAMGDVSNGGVWNVVCCQVIATRSQHSDCQHFAHVLYALSREGIVANSILYLGFNWETTSSLHSGPLREHSFRCVSYLFVVSFSPPFVIPRINVAFPHFFIQFRNMNKHLYLFHLFSKWALMMITMWSSYFFAQRNMNSYYIVVISAKAAHHITPLAIVFPLLWICSLLVCGPLAGNFFFFQFWVNGWRQLALLLIM
jgi:hypothetical protein